MEPDIPVPSPSESADFAAQFMATWTVIPSNPQEELTMENLQRVYQELTATGEPGFLPVSEGETPRMLPSGDWRLMCQPGSNLSPPQLESFSSDFVRQLLTPASQIPPRLSSGEATAMPPSNNRTFFNLTTDPEPEEPLLVLSPEVAAEYQALETIWVRNRNENYEDLLVEFGSAVGISNLLCRRRQDRRYYFKNSQMFRNYKRMQRALKRRGRRRTKVSWAFLNFLNEKYPNSSFDENTQVRKWFDDREWLKTISTDLKTILGMRELNPRLTGSCLKWDIDLSNFLDGDYDLGEFTAELDLNNLDLRFESHDRPGQQHPHPHICGSELCMGNYSNWELLFMQSGCLLTVVDTVNAVMNGYDPASAYTLIGSVIDGAEDSMYICSECADEVDSEDVYWTESGRPLCSGCAVRCERCDDYHSRREMTCATDGYYYCDDCRDDVLLYCEGCEEYVHEEDSTVIQDLVYCKNCVSELSVDCESCGDTLLKSHAETHTDGYSYCESCYEDVLAEEAAEDEAEDEDEEEDDTSDLEPSKELIEN